MINDGGAMINDGGAMMNGGAMTPRLANHDQLFHGSQERKALQ